MNTTPTTTKEFKRY
nr:unnamed protein product [Callosobruchus analis]